MPLSGRKLSNTVDKPKDPSTDPNPNRPKIHIPTAPTHANFEFGFCEDANLRRRRRMEDAHAFFYDFGGVENQGFFAIYDGHGGKSAADWCGRHLHELLLTNLEQQEQQQSHEQSKETTQQQQREQEPEQEQGRPKQQKKLPITAILDKTFIEADGNLDPAHGIFSGCTVIVALLRHELRDGKDVRVLYTANVGDARAVLNRGGQAIRLSFDHQARIPQEKQRIKDCGGLVINDRVNGTLAVTRALGDAGMKEFISGHPFTTETVLTDADEFLILACDGLWDICTDLEAVQYIANDYVTPGRAAELLVDFALEQGSTDNLSVLVVNLLKGEVVKSDQQNKE